MTGKDIEEIIKKAKNVPVAVHEKEAVVVKTSWLRTTLKEYGEKKYQEGQEDEAVRHQKEDFDAYRMGVIEGENTLTPEHKKELEDTYEKGKMDEREDIKKWVQKAIHNAKGKTADEELARLCRERLKITN